jgi:RNA polymerase sigma factor (sigma-70 family)
MGERDFEELFRTYHAVLVTAAYNRLSNIGDAEDAAAEVFAQAWRRRDEAAHVFTIAWLYSTLRNVIGNQYRGRTRHARRVERAEANHRDLGAEASEEVLDVRAAVNRLDPADRELIWMAFWEDLTREEMAEILGCSAATLRVRLHRAKKRLETALLESSAAVGAVSVEAT